jgi:CRISPR-associated protein Csm3
MKLEKYVKLSATLELKSGLHIGSATAKDAPKGEPLPVMKSIVTNLPYIPGSSIKGKMRCLFEQVHEKCPGGGPCTCGKCQICKLFGSGSVSNTYEPARLIFRDAVLDDNSKELLEKLPSLENKPGVSIDRNTGKARGGALFPMERVPEGCGFNLEISCRVLSTDNTDTIQQWLAVGLYMMEQDALGGGGSRGSGHIGYENIFFNAKRFIANWRDEAAKNMSALKP